MNMKIHQQKRGVAIAVVLVFCVAILGLVTVLVMNTRHHKGSHSVQYDQTRALMAARAAMQLAIYKFRVLPSEFYKIHELEKALKMNPTDPVLLAKLKEFNKIWVTDFDSEVADSPAAKIKHYMNSADNKGRAVDAPKDTGYKFRVEEFRLVSRKNKGYVKDYIKIRTLGIYGTSQKVLEELIEVQIAK
ncbi:MAG: hypothetical protein PWR01_3660 [Clostridiales bacterium]|jgi:hypothetical protein|nr:hypothetical protein [Clostridiales bacterium]MDN5282587.1 hypothetical protein [Candidatus Ozemobacter sp.]